MGGIWVFFFIKINPSFITIFSFDYSTNQSHSVLYWQWKHSPDHGDRSLSKMLSKDGSDEDTSARTKQKKAKGRKVTPAASNTWTEVSKHHAMNWHLSGETGGQILSHRAWPILSWSSQNTICDDLLKYSLRWRACFNWWLQVTKSLNQWTWLTHHSAYLSHLLEDAAPFCNWVQPTPPLILSTSNNKYHWGWAVPFLQQQKRWGPADTPRVSGRQHILGTIHSFPFLWCAKCLW